MKYPGIIKVEDLEPEALARYRHFYGRFLHYRRVLPTSPIGTGNSWVAYETAIAEMNITDEERLILKRLPLKETFPDVAEEYGY